MCLNSCEIPVIQDEIQRNDIYSNLSIYYPQLKQE